MSRYWHLFLESALLYRFLRDKVAIASFCVLALLVILSFSAPLIAPFDPYDPTQIDIMDSDLPPAWQMEGDDRFMFGTDAQGRDIWSTMLYGTRISITIGLFAVLLQAVLGIALGLTAGYFGGRIDSFLMRLADIQLSFSTLMVAIVVLAVFQASFGTELYNELAIFMLILVIGIAEWPQYARTVRASVLAEKKKELLSQEQFKKLLQILARDTLKKREHVLARHITGLLAVMSNPWYLLQDESGSPKESQIAQDIQKELRRHVVNYFSTRLRTETNLDIRENMSRTLANLANFKDGQAAIDALVQAIVGEQR